MNKLDDVFFTLFIIMFIGVAAFMGYEFRGKVECEKNQGYAYSMDYGKCVKVSVLE